MDLLFFPIGFEEKDAKNLGFRFGNVGTHSSRTMMLEELTLLLEHTPPDAKWPDYKREIIDGNCLGKPTAATRQSSAQRLRELYGLDKNMPLFAKMAIFWRQDAASRPLLSLLLALARDPLLRATAKSIMMLPENSEFSREAMRANVAHETGERFSDAILGKVIRNAASSWTQSGHLEGRTLKKRKRVVPSAYAVTFALWLAVSSGFSPKQSLTSAWVRILDCDPFRAIDIAGEAKRIGLLDLKQAGDVLELQIRA